MKRRTAIAMLLVACAPAKPADQPASGPQIDASAPTLQGATYVTGDGPRSLAEARGRLALVFFFATWNMPAQKAMATYQALLADDVALIAVSVDDPDDKTNQDVVDFVTDTGATYCVLWDKDKAVARRYLPETTPTTYLIDRRGMLRAIHIGFRPKIGDAVKQDLAELRGG